MSCDILGWYGMKRYPFDKEIKTTELVDTESLRECAARLEYMKRHGGIMLLTGDPGVGKTVALRRFVDNFNVNLFRAIYTPLTTLRGTDLLRHLSDKLGLPCRATKSATYLQIQREMLELRERLGKTMVLIIDEAHLLQCAAMQELRLLVNFKMDSFDPFILILSGQSDLRRVMEYAIMESFAQRLAMRFHMPGLGPKETAEYVRQNLKIAGCPEPVFCDDALSAIHEVAFGIPRRIGNVAEQALIYAMFDGKRTVDADTVLKVRKGT